MAAEILVFDPTAEGTGTQLLLTDSANGIDVISQAYPQPEDENTWASSARTEGARLANSKPGNREITLVIRCFGAAGVARNKLEALLEKVGKLKREGGTFKRTLGDSTVIVFDVETATHDIEGGEEWFLQHRDSVKVTVTLTCKPYGRGTESQLGTDAETSLPVAEVVATAPEGDVPALARLVVTDTDAEDQSFVAWGLQSRYYGTAATESLFYEAETRLRQGGAALAALSGASGGTVVTQGTLTPSYQSMLSLASSGTAYLSHVGDFNVWARSYRPTGNAGTVTMALEWGVGDFTRVTRNTAVVFDVDDREGSFVWSKLGPVNLPEVSKGVQQWDGRVIAKSSTTGDDLSVDCVWLQPTTEGAGEITAVPTFETLTAFSARDEFDQSAGALAGKTAPVGGVWAGAGDADDFTVEATGHTAQRTAVSDTEPRFDVSGVAAFTDQAVQVDVKASAYGGGPYLGLLARYVDANNWVRLVITFGSTPGIQDVIIQKRVAGTYTLLHPIYDFPVALNTWYSLRMQIDAAGQWQAWAWATGANAGDAIATGSDSVLATSGALASGKPGIVDIYGFASPAVTRSYDNFQAWVPSSSSSGIAIPASQSIEIRSDGVEREDSTGVLWVPITPEGDLPKIPCAGQEARSVRVSALTSRGNPDSTDPAIDDKTLTVHATPRYLSVPEP